MNTEIVTALIAAAGAAVLAALSYLLTKRQDRTAVLRQQKLEHYKDFALSLNGVMVTEITAEGRRDFARACNALNLIAPQAVLTALQDLVLEIKSSNPVPTKKNHDKALSTLFYAMRKDLGVSPADDADTFHVELWASIHNAAKK